MHHIKINNDEYRLAECWNELTPQELHYLVRLTQQEISLEHLKIHMMLYLLHAHVGNDNRIRGRELRIQLGMEDTHTRLCIGRKKYDVLPEDVIALSRLMEFLVEEEQAERYCIKPALFNNPYPELRILRHRFTGPDDCLYDITFEQYIYLQTYQDAMRNDPEKVNWVLACVWHRGKSFDIDRLERDAALLQRLPADQKMVMYWFVSSCLSNFGEQFPRLFVGGKETISHNVLDMQLRLLDSLANHDMTKKDAVRKGLLMDALYSMDESIRRQEEMEDKVK